MPQIWFSESGDYPGEKRWCFHFDTGRRLLEVELFADGSCEWFALDRETKGSGTGNDREPFVKVAADPAFKAAMEALR
jgi:hypothetical protein